MGEKIDNQIKEQNIGIWQIATGVLAIMLVVSGFYIMTKKEPAPLSCPVLQENQTACQTEQHPTKQQVSDKTIEYINKYLMQEGMTASLKSITDNGTVYELKLLISGREYNTYTTKDGKFFFSMPPFDLDKPLEIIEETETQPQTVPKSDKPTVQLFVMSYCPYGTQMQKAIEPVHTLLGSKADIKVEFVSYVMHGAKEVQENVRQYCIMQNNPDKYWSYLKCFLGSQNAASCMENNSISNTTINSCINETYYKYNISESGTSFPIHAADNTKYGVRGSPTLVINGVTVNVARSPEEVKKAICNAFNIEPEECKTTLSTAQASPGFGYGTGYSSSGGECG